ncbi:hypothetical protein E2C01_096388 [Portunus trituberculatus]|uniref:Uncharacterized protein n=1 Tax=Portunus trituberculatus TaxID=210409 RepID=A0A5B7JXT8_PORTR|nr:hypothetical protein [Portunus trituberculatus]
MGGLCCRTLSYSLQPGHTGDEGGRAPASTAARPIQAAAARTDPPISNTRELWCRDYYLVTVPRPYTACLDGGGDDQKGKERPNA